MSRRDFEVICGEEPERAVLVGVDLGDAAWPLEESLAELERLADTAGAVVVGRLSQRLEAPNSRTFIGPGKAEELTRLVQALEANLVIFDDELTPSQQNNLEKLVGAHVKVIDRTALILDIFALHATSREGRLQVRLAQNQYLYPRLRGMWSHLASNRMGGGVGSRFGEGESQLEVDRRLVRKRISRIRRELGEVARSRTTQRKGRNVSSIFRIALAGYTNAGKSSLMNRMTGAQVLSYDKLFATLDSTTRRLQLDAGPCVTMTDTVGFIQKLPHSLVEAFRSTLDEIREADLILLVVDASDPQRAEQIKAVREVLGQIGADAIETIVVYNKIDLLAPEELAHLRGRHPQAAFTSTVGDGGGLVSVTPPAGEGALDAPPGACDPIDDGIGALRDRIQTAVLARDPLIEVLIPYAQGSLVQLAHERTHVEAEDYEEAGTRLRIRVPAAVLPTFAPFACGEDAARYAHVGLSDEQLDALDDEE